MWEVNAVGDETRVHVFGVDAFSLFLGNLFEFL